MQIGLDQNQFVYLVTSGRVTWAHQQPGSTGATLLDPAAPALVPRPQQSLVCLLANWPGKEDASQAFKYPPSHWLPCTSPHQLHTAYTSHCLVEPGHNPTSQVTLLNPTHIPAYGYIAMGLYWLGLSIWAVTLTRLMPSPYKART